jgi:RNA polymerase sigma-70 factor, ECF subfamily
MQDDISVVVQVKKGNKNAFETLLLKYEKFISRHVRNTIYASREDKEDIVADVFIKAYKNIHLYKEDFAFSTWIMRIAHYTCIDFIRKQSLRKMLRLDIDTHIEDERPIAVIDGSEIEYALLIKLTQYERSLLLMHYVDEMKYIEIALVLDKRPNNIAVQVLRAKQKIIKYYEK